MKKEDFNLTLAKECTEAFTETTELGRIVSDKRGVQLTDYGYSCVEYRIYQMVGRSYAKCVDAQNYGMAEAERFGGKYILLLSYGFPNFRRYRKLRSDLCWLFS